MEMISASVVSPKGPRLLADQSNPWQSRKGGYETRLSSTSSPQATAKNGPITDLLLSTLLVLYFWGSCIFLAVAQYLGMVLYFLDKEYYYRYMSFTKTGMGILIITLTQWFSPTLVRISGDKSVDAQIWIAKDGRARFNFPERLVLIANHQLYSDWVYLWWAAYENQRKVHGHIFIVLKEAIRYVPIVGPGLMFAGFIFMSRNLETDQPRLTRRTNQLRHRGSRGLAPMWLMMFPEGTNLGKNGRKNSSRWAEKQGIQDLRHQVIPRSTGTYLCLKALEGTVEYVYDCTLGYNGIPNGEYGQDIFTLSSVYFQGRAPIVNMHWRCFKVSEIPLDSPEAFNEWLQGQWLIKDKLLEEFSLTGRFPSSLSCGHDIETQVGVAYWGEIWKIVAIPAALGIFIVMARSFLDTRV